MDPKTPLPSAASTALSIVVWALLAALVSALTSCSPGSPPNIVLITMDTTRADHLGCYGYPRDTSPHLDALASEATRYSEALSTTSWTFPSHASLFTGKFPATHGARWDPQGSLMLAQAVDAPRNIRMQPLSPDEATLAELLRDAGYDTGAVVGGPVMMRVFGLDSGFDFYDDSEIADKGGRRADSITRSAIEWLTRKREGPFFLFLNYFDPHAPYDPPQPHAGAFLPPGVRPDPKRHKLALYDAEIRLMDEQIGHLLDFLRDRGIYDRTSIVVTADHGELLGERGEWGHMQSLWEPLMRIPLLVKEPGSRRGRVDDTRLQILDVFAIVLDQAGVESPAGVQGQLPSHITHPFLAEVKRIDPEAGDSGWRSQWRGSRKILRSNAGRRLLVDLASDPEEKWNLLAGDAQKEQEAMGELDRVFASLPDPPGGKGPEVRVDAETRDALRRLGYLEEEAEPLDED